jgi:hypothetical protein
MDFGISLLTTVTSLIFGVIVLRQYLARRRPYQLVWSAGLFVYALAALAQAVAEVAGWSPALYKAWYVLGGLYAAAWLGMGTVYLLAPRRIAHVIFGAVAIASLAGLLLVLAAEVPAAALPRAGHPTVRVMPPPVRLTAVVLNIFGTAALVGGAAWSAWSCWRRGAPRERVVSTALIAVGGLLPATAGTLLAFGLPDLFYLLTFLGILVIFAGFLANYEIVAVRLLPRTAQ